MKIFISWSGQRSKAAALALRSWLPDLIQNIDPWMSAEDIEAGSRWSKEIDQQLQESNFGIICLTKENASAPWINFEAGAIAKSVNNSRVCPYLLNLKPAQIPRGPLNLFQSKMANKDETFDLVQAINKTMQGGLLTEQQLTRAFDRWWPDLEQKLSQLPDEKSVPIETISEEQAISEILDTVRSISRKLARDDMEREIIRATKDVFPRKSNKLFYDKLSKYNLFDNDFDIEKKIREVIMELSIEELEKLYKMYKEQQAEQSKKADTDVK